MAKPGPRAWPWSTRYVDEQPLGVEIVGALEGCLVKVIDTVARDPLAWTIFAESVEPTLVFASSVCRSLIELIV
jgi:hypothetical protein